MPWTLIEKTNDVALYFTVCVLNKEVERDNLN